MNRSKRGFTLIEVLVVVSILGVLMGLVSILVMRSGAHQQKNDAQQLVGAYMPNLVERYYAEFNRLPPSTVKALNLARKPWKDLGLAENQTNDCIEVLVVALRHPDFTARLEEGDIPGSDPFGNTDDDIWTQVPDGSSNEKAMEVLDPWGNPIAYFPKSQYDKPVQIMNAVGDVIEVHALKRPDGSWYNPTKFQIISVGKNGEQDDPGPGDDFMNFKIEGE